MVVGPALGIGDGMPCIVSHAGGAHQVMMAENRVNGYLFGVKMSGNLMIYFLQIFKVFYQVETSVMFPLIKNSLNLFSKKLLLRLILVFSLMFEIVSFFLPFLKMEE